MHQYFIQCIRSLFFGRGEVEEGVNNPLGGEIHCVLGKIWFIIKIFGALPLLRRHLNSSLKHGYNKHPEITFSI